MQTRTPRRVPRRTSRRPLAAALAALTVCGAIAAMSQTSVASPQQATISVLPGIVQPGKKTANADKALAAVVATFSPAKKGRAVELQRRDGSKWVKVATGVQDKTGKVEFAAPAGTTTSPITYRAVAAKGSGLGTVASKSVATSQWGAATFTDQFTGTALTSNWVQRMQFYQPESMRNCSKGRPCSDPRGRWHAPALGDRATPRCRRARARRTRPTARSSATSTTASTATSRRRTTSTSSTASWRPASSSSRAAASTRPSGCSRRARRTSPTPSRAAPRST